VIRARRILTTGVLIGTIASAPFVTLPAIAQDNARITTSTLCGDSSQTCPSIQGVVKVGISEAVVTHFLVRLWNANSLGPPIYGKYQLQRCSNPSAAPSRVTCVLWSTGTRTDLKGLSTYFKSSKIFKTVSVHYPTK